MSDEYREVDGGAGDHLSDAAELTDPYPATRAAYASSLRVEPGETHTDPGDAGEDVARYAASPLRIGPPVRLVIPREWNANTFMMTAGAQAFQVAEYDPFRSYLKFWNHSDGIVYLANSPVRQVGPGVLMLPARDADGRSHVVELRTTAAVYLFTESSYTLTTNTRVAWYVERMP